MSMIARNERIIMAAAVVATVLSGVLHYSQAGGVVLTFAVAAVALATLAAVVGEATDQLGGRLNPGATGVLQSAIGNLPELFVGIFALRAGLVAGIGAAFVSDWFVAPLKPAIKILNISETFIGLVVVAIAGNAVENVVGIQLAVANKPDYAVSVILNSSLQVALALTPALVLLSFVVSDTHFQLVMPPLLIVALGLASALGVALIGLYSMIAASFWWGVGGYARAARQT
jgi:Ca2+:H+ antiporter